ncbi:MAG: RluA family pseudouridine synthase [SAR86 cluster bacterium]|uniref:Pseudouridine synthase n=1 Tax=SAR86 cluster bacterium TaxID=2030880 RepID=A0A838YUE9_9GAMM|nr:RluA family pseudouridine synthase [SAR86 cluster bacterium]
MSVKKIVVDEDSSKRRLDNYLLTLLFDLPKSKVYSMVRKGEVRINSGRVKPSTKINVGDEIRLPPYINIPKKDEVRIPDNLKKTISQAIIYEDKNYIIINKPTGIAVHGGTDNKFGLITIMRDMFSEKIDLCHRIDKETSGCLVFSLNKKSTKHFNYLLQSRKVTKKYKAILKGAISKDIFINNYIGDEPQLAISKFNIINSSKNASYVDIEITTGRTHQIRIHSNEIGHPVINDSKYGDWKFNRSIKNFGKRMALHAHTMEFTDQLGKQIKVVAKLDKDFNDLLKLLN